MDVAHHHFIALQALVAGLDMLCVFAGGELVAWWLSNFTYRREIASMEAYNLLIVTAALTMPLCVHVLGGYRRNTVGHSWRRPSRVISAWTLVFVAAILLTVGFKVSGNFSRAWFLLWYPTVLALLGLTHLGLGILRRTALQAGLGVRRIVLLGAADSAAELVRNVQQHAADQVCFLGRFGPAGAVEGVPRLGSTEDAAEILYRDWVGRADEVWILQSEDSERLVHQLYYSSQLDLFELRFVPHLHGYSVSRESLHHIGSQVVIGLSTRPLRGVEGLLKGVIDRCGAFFGLVFLSPLLLGLAVAVRLDSAGPVFFRQPRHGVNGREFHILKFRTLIHREEPPGELQQVCEGDARFTRVGQMLRRWSLDELPQLINVLKGEMSLVGPRPHELSMNRAAAQDDFAYRLRHRVLPGMTGWAQVNGSRGPVRSSEEMRQRLQLDLYYIENWSLWLDIRILFRTFWIGATSGKGL